MQLLSVASYWKVNSTRTGSLLVLFSGVPPAPTLLCLFLAYKGSRNITST